MNVAMGRTGFYGVDLPKHEPRLVFKKDDVGGNCTGGLTQNPDPQHQDECFLNLTGVRLRVGNYESSQCNPLTGDGAEGDITANVGDVASLRLPGGTRLHAEARPVAGNYNAVKPSRVAAWLDTPKGDVAVPSASSDSAEFRPSLHKVQPTDSVLWSVDTDTDAPCLRVTPFGNGQEKTIILTPTSGVPTTIKYLNMPEPAGAGHTHGRRGASYDVELIYDLLEQRPNIPPVPFRLFERPLNNASAELEYMRDCVAECIARDTVNLVTGENCGPLTNSAP